MQSSVAELTIISISSLTLLGITAFMIFAVTILRLMRINKYQQQPMPIQIHTKAHIKSPIAPEVLQELIFRQHAIQKSKLTTREVPSAKPDLKVVATQEARRVTAQVKHITPETETQEMREQSYPAHAVSTSAH